MRTSLGMIKEGKGKMMWRFAGQWERGVLGSLRCVFLFLHRIWLFLFGVFDLHIPRSLS